MTLEDIEKIHTDEALVFSKKYPNIIFTSSIKIGRFIWLIVKENMKENSVMHPILATKEDDIRSAITSVMEKQLL